LSKLEASILSPDPPPHTPTHTHRSHQGAPLLLAPRNAPPAHTLLPPQLLPAVAARAVLGRVICLGAVERHDVNRLLSSIIGSSLMRVACCGAPGIDLARWFLPDVGRWNLCNPDMVRSYSPGDAYPNHAQRPLQPSGELLQLCEGVLGLERYSPEEGFVGMAVNLIHCTEEQLQVVLNVPATVHGGCFRACQGVCVEG